MAGFDLRKSWWIVLAVGSVLSIAIAAIGDVVYGAGSIIVGVLALGVLGIAFLWVYVLDPEERWWAIIPGMALFSVVAAMLADWVLGTESTNDWVNVLVLGAGAGAIALVVKRPNARVTLIMISAITILVGILMSPLWMPARVALAIVALALGGFAAWRVVRARPA